MHFLATQNTNVAFRPKYECVARSGNASEFYINWKLTIENSKWGRYLVVNVSHNTGISG